MTPDKAGDLLDGTTPGPWFFDDDMAGRMHKIGPIVPAGTELECTTDDAALAAHAPDMAHMIANMREEWRVEFQAVDDRKWYPLTGWVEGEPDRRPWNVAPTRIVRRYVTEPEEA